jgi:phosphoglycerate dehydrogenase-like enzyme
MAKPKILICIPGGFVANYFKPADMKKLKTLGDVTLRDDLVVKKDEVAYNQLVRDLRPRILMTGWGSPQLQAATVAEVPELEYMCHVTGSVRANIEKAAMEVAGPSRKAALLVSNWGTVGAKPVAEGSLMMILAGLRRAWQHNKVIHQQGGWDRKIGSKTLFYQKVGIHGMGYIAQETIKLMKPFHCELTGYSPHAPDEIFKEHGVRRVTDLKELYATNMIISCHANKTDENFHIVNAEVLRAMPNGAGLVNTGRGAVIDEQALIAELQTGRIWAALDVFEKEPLPVDSPLRQLDNVLLFPHTGGGDTDNDLGMAAHAVKNVGRFLKGKPVEAIVPASRYDLMT